MQSSQHSDRNMDWEKVEPGEKLFFSFYEREKKRHEVN